MGNQFTRAIVCPPGATFADGLTTVSLGTPILEKAIEQHRAYCKALEAAGLEIIALTPDAEYPDSTFVEDTAVLTPSWAVITRPGALSRAGEVARMTQVLSNYYQKHDVIEPPGTLDGGDICEIEDRFLVGLSDRTNEEGARQLDQFLLAHDRAANIVDIRAVEGILHLKSGVTYIGDNRLLVIRSLADKIEPQGRELVIVPEGEEYAANCIRVNDQLLMPAGFPKLRRILNDLNYSTVELETSEFQKMDGGLSCLSLRF
ncbi:MAG: arginine deiminase family protein [Pyrinomonadaceae bacterium]